MSLIKEYEAAIERGEIRDNEEQRIILSSLQRLTDELNKDCRSWFGWYKGIKGLYLYGPVGVGKTYLVDLFYQQLAIKKKARFHFHHFMQQIDIQLRKKQGIKDPLRQIAKEVAKTTKVLCFDEFLVNDVAYAMILAELLTALVASGVILVISSNTKPDDLYLKGVQRQRFLPAIALLKNHCEVLYLKINNDYRLGRVPLLEAYLSPLTTKTADIMAQQFELIAPIFEEKGTIMIQNRLVPYEKCGIRAIWFHFDLLCNFPRSQLDYLEIADKFDTVFLSEVPQLTANHTAQTIMFIHLIDVMYDRGIKLILSAAVPIAELYVAGEMKETFNRTLSRLNEMQSIDYLSRHPKRKVENIL